MKASAGTGISEPSFLQNFANDPTFVGNRALRPERSRSFEAGLERHFLGSALVVEETVFDNRFRDLIVFTPLAPPSLSTWVNLEGSRARGLESSARLRMAWMRVRAQYTFLDTRVTASASPASAATGIGQELPRRPRHSASLDFTAVFRRVPEGYAAFVEELPGANTQGATLEEARANLAEAVVMVLEANRELAEEELRGQDVIREPLLLGAA